MPHLPPVPRADLHEFEPLLQSIEQRLGMLPNSTLTMGHRPDIMSAFTKLNGVVMGPGQVDEGLKRMIASVVSNAAGCRYCQAHTTHSAEDRAGVPAEKIAALFEFEQSDLFDEAERAALRVALGAGLVPNEVTDEQMADLRRHFDVAQCVEIIGVIAVFGFLNRWNDTIGTELEQSPLAYAQERLAEGGWEVGRHAGPDEKPDS